MKKIELMLNANIHSIHGKLLVQKKSIVNYEIFEKIASESLYCTRMNVKLKESFIYNDAYICCHKAPYNSYCQKVNVKDVLKIFGDISVPIAILDEFSFMRIKDEYTYFHSINTTLLVICLSLLFYDDYQKVLQLATASFCHDIGKSRIPSSILHSPMPLSNEEFDIIKEHTVYGTILCCHYFGDFFSPSTIAAFQHHEKKNGTGYPVGINLRDENVMFISIVDIFDALISKRPYRNEPYDVRGAIDVLCMSVEKGEFDKEKLKMLISLNREPEESIDDIKCSVNYRGKVPKLNNYGIRLN
jgi:HD-GYP domain-containing protein (c-di-GMP phosphodiesterase class II)